MKSVRIKAIRYSLLPTWGTCGLSLHAPEQSAGSIHIGDVLLVAFDSLPGQVFKANVTRVSPVLDSQMRRVQIRAELDNADLKLRPEMYGRAQLADPNATMALRVPLSALSTDGIYTTVFICAL